MHTINTPVTKKVVVYTGDFLAEVMRMIFISNYVLYNGKYLLSLSKLLSFDARKVTS